VASLLLLLFRVFGAFINNLKGIIYGRLIGEIFIGLIFIIYIYRRYVDKAPLKSMSSVDAKSIRNYSIVNTFIAAVWIIFMLNDTFLLGLLLKDSIILAEYKVAYVIPGSLLIISSSLIAFVLPFFTKREHEKDNSWIRKNLFFVTLFTTLSIFLISILIFIFRTQIVYILFGSDYHNSILLMSLLLVATLINGGIRYPIASLLSAMGKVKYNLYISIFGVLAQVVLNIFFIPIIGVFSVIYSSIIIYIIMSLSLIFLAYKVYFPKEILM
jgi:O-antigen/teichoic acid export membrane protein